MSALYSFKGNNPLSRDKLNYDGGSIRNIHYGDIHTKFATHFYVDKESVPYINDGESHSAIRPENYCAAGDLIFADASEDENDIGKVIEVIDAGGIPIVSGLHTILARPNSPDFVVGFGAYLFSSEGVRRQIQREAQGAKVLGISAARLGGVELRYPNGPVEQQKIVDCLSAVDECIGAETRKLDALKAHKQGLMQQLFPAEGQRLPRLRFPGFEGEWLLKSLGAVCTMQAGKFVSASKISAECQDGMYPCFGGNGLRGFTETFTHEGEFPLIGRQGAHCGNVVFVAGRFHATEHAVVVSSKRGINANLLYYLLRRLALNRFATGQAQPGLSVDVLEKVECVVPKNLEEQYKVASVLSSLDGLIARQSRKISLLRQHKKGLMQGLFPPMHAEAA